MTDNKPLQHPLGVLVEDVGAEGSEALPDQPPGGLVLLLQLEQHGEPHHLGVKAAQGGQALRHGALEAGHGVVLGLSLGDDEGSGVYTRGRGQRGLDSPGGPEQRQLPGQRRGHAGRVLPGL